MFLAAGAKGIQMPDFDDARTAFDQALLEEAAPVDARTAILRRALGLDDHAG